MSSRPIVYILLLSILPNLLSTRSALATNTIDCCDAKRNWCVQIHVGTGKSDGRDPIIADMRVGTTADNWVVYGRQLSLANINYEQRLIEIQQSVPTGSKPLVYVKAGATAGQLKIGGREIDLFCFWE